VLVPTRDVDLTKNPKNQADADGHTGYDGKTFPVFGDGHGSVLYAIHSLVQEGIIDELPDDVYARMQTLYAKPPRLSLEVIKTSGYELNPEQENALSALLEAESDLSPDKLSSYIQQANLADEPDTPELTDEISLLRDKQLKIPDYNQHKKITASYRKASPLTNEELTEFCDLMRDHIKFKERDVAILFLGDMFGDRGRNDWLMLELFDIIVDSGNYPIEHFSNHDWALLDYLFSKEIEAALKTKVFKNDKTQWAAFLRRVESNAATAPGKVHKIFGPDQARSLYELIECITSEEHPEITLEACRERVKKVLLPCLQLMTSVYDKEKGGGHLLAHAPVGPETVAALAKLMKVDCSVGDSQGLHTTISNINKKWQQQYVKHPTFLSAAELKAQYVGDPNVLNGACPLKLPILRVSHNRPDDADVAEQSKPFSAFSWWRRSFLTILSDKVTGMWAWVHGHSGPIVKEERSMVSYRRGVINMDGSGAGRKWSFGRGNKVLVDVDSWRPALSVRGALSALLPRQIKPKSVLNTQATMFELQPMSTKAGAVPLSASNSTHTARHG
jgi:hypothetical protein